MSFEKLTKTCLLILLLGALVLVLPSCSKKDNTSTGDDEVDSAAANAKADSTAKMHATHGTAEKAMTDTAAEMESDYAAKMDEAKTAAETATADTPKLDIVDTAVSAGDFKTLATALSAAGLVETLKGEGPFTVFAPTDEAFAKLPEGTLVNLLKPENKADLVSILTYHVVPGKVMAADVAEISSAKTVNGKPLAIEVKNGDVMVNSAKVLETDIACSNGVIHVVDAVILPK